jgi:nicotinamidase-related amidase
MTIVTIIALSIVCERRGIWALTTRTCRLRDQCSPGFEGKEQAMPIDLKKVLRVLAGILSISVLSPLPNALAQTPEARARPSVLPAGGGAALLDPSDTVFLLLDHQTGLFQTVKDISVAELRSNTVLLAKLVTLMKIPVITTASEPNGTNGPLMPEIHQFAPHAVYVGRKGEVNAWDNEDFVRTVRATGRKTLIMAGVWTSVCVMFPALDATVAGFKVYAVMDASGDVSEMANRTTLARFVQGGVIPVTTNAVLSEIHRTWNRPEAAEIGGLYAHVSPNYTAVVESYVKAQEVARQSKVGQATPP